MAAFSAASKVAAALRRGADPSQLVREDGSLRIHPTVFIEACGLAELLPIEVYRAATGSPLSAEDILAFLARAVYGEEGALDEDDSSELCHQMGHRDEPVWLAAPVGTMYVSGDAANIILPVGPSLSFCPASDFVDPIRVGLFSGVRQFSIRMSRYPSDEYYVRVHELIEMVCEAAIRGELPNLKMLNIADLKVARARAPLTLRVPRLETFTCSIWGTGTYRAATVLFPDGLPSYGLSLHCIAAVRSLIVPALAGPVRLDGYVHLGGIVTSAAGGPVGDIECSDLILRNVQAGTVTAHRCALNYASCDGHVGVLISSRAEPRVPECDVHYHNWVNHFADWAALAAGEPVNLCSSTGLGDELPVRVDKLILTESIPGSELDYDVSIGELIYEMNDLNLYAEPEDFLQLMEWLRHLINAGTVVRFRFSLKSLRGAPYVSAADLRRVDALEQTLRDHDVLAPDAVLERFHTY